MIDLTLSRESAALLGAKMEAYISENTLQAGLGIYKKQQISHIWKDSFNIIHALVGVPGADHKLQIDLDFFMASECNCGSRFCPHMAAVYFELLSRHESPDVWLSNIVAAVDHRRASSVEGQATGVRLTEQPVPEHALPPPEEWDSWIDKQLDRLIRRHTDRFRIDIFYYTAYKKICALGLPLQASEEAFYRLFCALKSLLHAERQFAIAGDEFTQSYYAKAATDLQEHFAGHIREQSERIHSYVQTDKTIPYVSAIKNTLQRDMPLHVQTAFHWIDIHRLLWSQLLNRPDDLEQEADRLSRFFDQADAGKTELLARISLMAAYIDWLLGRDDSAMRKLANVSAGATSMVISSLDIMYQTESWSRLERWLSFALSMLRRAPVDAFNRTLAIWRHVAEHTANNHSYADALRVLLPRSYPQFTEYLIATEQYDEWVQFHLLNGIPPAKIDRAQWKQVEDRDPSLVHPILHHAIERLLSERNRSAYREAVKQTRRLRQTYTSAGQEAVFEQFASTLTARYGRLHAFMEELGKGLTHS